MMAPGVAQAACSPNPAQPGERISCSGTETSRIVVRGGGAELLVEQGATVAAADAAISIRIERSYSPYSQVAPTTLQIDGNVGGGTSSAIALMSFGNYGWTEATITVSSTGRITGPTAIDLQRPRSNGSTGYELEYLRTAVELDNGGVIESSTGGIAVRGSDDGRAYFSSIINRADGAIGAIQGRVDSIINEGMIDGGALSAVTSEPGQSNFGFQSYISNSGTIRASGAADTLGFRGSANVYNDGAILAEGMGRAISGRNLTIVNGEGGSIVANHTAIDARDSLYITNEGTILSGGDAIRTSGSLFLDNQGTIKGNVVGGDNGSSIYNIGGTIEGDVLLGSGNDTFIVGAANVDQPFGTVTGRVDAGGGVDTLLFSFEEDRVLDRGIVLPDTFETLRLSVSGGSTLTLSESYASTTALTLSSGDHGSDASANRFLLAGSIDTQGPALMDGLYNSSGFEVAHSGTIVARLTDPSTYAVSFGSASLFDNSGTITAIGGGGVAGSTRIVNSGTITAKGTALRAWAGFDNSGTIRSIAGVGVDVLYNESSNSGTIEGATAGVRLVQGTLVNSGTISSAGTGLEVGWYGTLFNQAGGVITGGTAGIAAPSNTDIAGAYIVNAGIVNGDVNLGSRPYNLSSGNIFAALSGSMVNGDIYLGSGYDMFATSLVNDGPGEFAGLTGRVTGSGDETLRYIIDADTVTTPELKGIFKKLSYQLANDATLTLDGPSNIGVGLAGSGKVVLTGEFTGDTTRTMFDLTATAIRLNGEDQVPANAIAMTNTGRILFVETPPVSYSNGTAIVLSDGSSFTNEGVIVVTVGQAGSVSYPYLTGIANGGGLIVNNGTIQLSGAFGLRSFSSNNTEAEIRNTGVIEQISGGARSIGIFASGRITNSGRIDTQGSAVSLYDSAFVTNNGVLRSSAAQAVSSTQYNSPTSLWNQANGLIAGAAGFSAVQLSSGSVLRNEGTIEGDVALRYDPYGFAYDFGTSVFINRGGTLNGNLTLTKNDDILIALGGLTGVTGSIETLTGSDTFVWAYDASATVTLDADATPPDGFEQLGFAAYGAHTVLTLAGQRSQTQPLILAGDGTIVNSITLNEAGATGITSVTLGSAADPTNALGAGSTLAFVNRGTLARGVGGYAREIDNQGTINGYDLYRPVVRIQASDAAGFTFRNSGTITAVPAPQNVFGGSDWYAVAIDKLIATGTLAFNSFDNSGQIAGGVSIVADTRSFSFANSGRIDAANPSYGAARLIVGPRYSLEYPRSANADDASIVNSGTMNGSVLASLAASRVTMTNTGSINGYLSVSQPGKIDGFDDQGYPAQTSQESFSLTNSGSIWGATVSSRALAIDVANSGTIGDPEAGAEATALEIDAYSRADQAIRVVNDGSIVGSGLLSSGLTIGSYTEEGLEGESAPPVSAISIVNRGVISADGGAGYSAAIDEDTPAELIPVAGLGVSLGGDGASAVSIVNEAGATISANGATSYVGRSWEPDDTPRIVPDAYSGTGSIAVVVAADKLMLDNAGTIRGNAGGTIDGDTEFDFYFDDIDLAGTFMAGAVQTFGSIDTLTNRSTGVIIGSVDLGDMDDMLVNAGRIEGDVYLRAGNDSVTHNIGGGLTGTIDGGEGTDAAIIDINGGGLLGNALLARFVNFESKLVTGTGTVTTDGAFADETLFLRDAALTLSAGQTLQTAGPVAVTFSGGTNLLVNNGTILGGLDLTNGLNQVVNAGTINGAIVFGQGSQLTSLANSTIIGAINVPQGATFASAGTVNGAVNVSGTLAPGASPGTMTVNGNVTLNAGSNTLFEFTPTVSDALIVNGSLTIADGAALTLTGSRPLTPGVYTIVRASNGISGSFGTNIMRDDQIAGILSFGAKQIDLVGLFLFSGSASAQAEQTRDYLNDLLLDGKATPGILAAFPRMVGADGYASAAALSTLSPEPYASAAQIGIENGLAIAGALRSVRMAGLSEEGGLFTFGQAYGNWRTFAPDRRGVAQADVDSSGYLGGVGYGNNTVGAALFVGRSDSKQRLGAIGARNDADGMFLGGRVHYAAGGLSAGATILFDRAKADTVRNLVGGSSARSRYKLHGMTIDGWVGYGWDIRDGWRVGPQLGLTHISVDRGAARETGGGAFALDVSKQKYDATFLGADLKLEAPGTQSLRPWVSIGVRHMLEGDAIGATGGIASVGATYSVAGVERRETVPHVGGGLNVAISASVSLFVNGDAEFSGSNGQQHVNGGVTFKF
ncbi:autotransporter domain-containing protein [Sphingobium sp.]|uniref:autotransporter domain-containing protein n=1 Tax=Sphingobium sp. TaxID=1912891 RepID=UPI002E1CF90B